MHYFHSLMAILNRWTHLGNRETSHGVRLIGQMPSLIQRDKLIPMHVVYEPLDESDILRLETILGHALPSALRAFYSRANGFSIFGGILSMKGLRHDYSRELTDKGMYQPTTLEYGNTIERPIGYSTHMTFFSWYDYDASKVYARSDDNRIFMCQRYAVQPTLFEWPDLQTFLLSEAERLASLFDERGCMLDENASGLPLEALRGGGNRH